MTISGEVTAALITGAIAIILSLITILVGWFNVKDLREIIAALRERINDLEDANADLEDWAHRLVNQVLFYKGVPEKLIRRRKDKQE